MQDIRELFFVGTMYPQSLKGLEIGADGAVRLNSVEVREGTVADLQLIAAMPYLEKLALVKQPVSDVTLLSDMTRLQEVNLSCSGVSSLEGFSNLPMLRELNLEHTKVRDLTPLRDAPLLETVTVSMDMLPMALDPEAAYEVILKP